MKALRHAIPCETGFDAIEGFIGKLTRVAAFDLAQERIDCFSSFRFLYERLLGAEARELEQLVDVALHEALQRPASLPCIAQQAISTQRRRAVGTSQTIALGGHVVTSKST